MLKFTLLPKHVVDAFESECTAKSISTEMATQLVLTLMWLHYWSGGRGVQEKYTDCKKATRNRPYCKMISHETQLAHLYVM
jgi:hypothetical protein